MSTEKKDSSSDAVGILLFLMALTAMFVGFATSSFSWAAATFTGMLSLALIHALNTDDAAKKIAQALAKKE